MKGCSSVPNNQSLAWYQQAIKNYGRGNGGEGKDYEYSELVNMYYHRCSIEEEKAYNLKMEQAEQTPARFDTTKFLTKINMKRICLESCFYCYKMSKAFSSITFKQWQLNELAKFTDKLLEEK